MLRRTSAASAGRRLGLRNWRIGIPGWGGLVCVLGGGLGVVGMLTLPEADMANWLRSTCSMTFSMISDSRDTSIAPALFP